MTREGDAGGGEGGGIDVCGEEYRGVWREKMVEVRDDTSRSTSGKEAEQALTHISVCINTHVHTYRHNDTHVASIPNHS